MSYHNGVLTSNNSIGPQGLPGIGFKLDANNDYDIQNKKMVNVKEGTHNNDVVTKSQLDSEIANISIMDTSQFVKKSGSTMTGDLILQPQSYPIHGDTNKVISYNTARNIFLSKKEGGSMLQSLDMNNHFVTNVKDPVNSDHGVNKKYVDNSVKNKADLSKTTKQTFQGRLQIPDFNSGQNDGSDIVNLNFINNTFLNKKTGGILRNPISFLSSASNNNKQIHNLGTPRYNSSAANKQYVDSEIIKIQSIKKDGSVSMTGDLNLNNNKIINLQTDSKNSKSAVNVELMENEITDLRNLVTQKIHESQIINSGQKKDAFRYLMENDDESSSESNIQVLGIVDFSNSPHQINKKAYQLKLLFQKSSPNQYQSRLGFNLYKLPVGYYTFVVEWFPPEMSELSVTVQGTTISISNYATKTFENYTKTVVNFHRWGSSPPQFIYLNLNGTVTFPSLLTIGHLIVYGVKETISNVDPSVYDTAFAIENGKMVMETDLSLNGHNLRGSVHYINGFLNSTKGDKNFVLNGAEIISLPGEAILKNIDIYCTRPITSSSSHITVHKHKKISLKLKTSLRNFFTGTISSSINFTSVKSGWYQTINPNSFQMPSSGILSFELNMNDAIWKSYNAIILHIKYQTSA